MFAAAPFCRAGGIRKQRLRCHKQHKDQCDELEKPLHSLS